MSFFAKQRFGVALTLLCATLCGTSANAQQTKADNSILSIERNTDNTPSLITFSPTAGWKKGQEQEIFKKYLGVDGINTTMQLVYSTTTKMNVTTSRYAEYYKGIKVEYGSYTLTEKDGIINFITGNHYSTAADVSAVPVLTEATAFGKALEFVGATKYMWQDPSAEDNLKATYHKPDTSYLPKGQLIWVENRMTSKTDRQLHLAYAFNVYAQAPLSRQMVYVDAKTGTILHTNSIIKHTAATGKTKYSGVVPFITAHVGTSYRLYDSTRGNGIYTRSVNHNTSVTGVTDFTSTTNTWPNSTADTQALDVHWAIEKVYDYWSTQQGRLSYDDANSTLYSYIHMNDASGGGALDNAYWDGAEMCYGDGSGSASGGFDPLVSLDVSGHELGHGVCEYTANLAYQYESGGINEGLSDCWGATIEHWADPHEVDAVAKSYWKIGEEIGGGNPLRSMDFPHNESNPDTWGTSDAFWYDITGCTPSNATDQCGVHTNSGITNKWYYLLVTGGTGTNAIGSTYSVTGIGWSEAPNILYQTELTLPSTSTYAQFRSASIAAASTIYGPCSAEVIAVTNAWYAVGVGTQFVPCIPQIGFKVTTLNTTEYAATTSCPASRTISIGLKPLGLAITGGNPVVTVVVGHGTAVAGVDYNLTGTSLTFLANDTTSHYATLTIFDNGIPNDDKTLVLGFTIAAMGSTAVVSPIADSMFITINNNDSGVFVGNTEYHTLNVGTAATCNLTSAFPGTYKRSRTQWILTAAEMTAAGVRAGVPISQIGFTLVTKGSTAAFQNYAINMANTTATDVSSAFVTTGFVNVVPAAARTTNLGLDTIGFTTNFVWDGTSNVMVQACYGSNAAAFGSNDQMMGIAGGADICIHVQSNSTGTTGCNLTYDNSGTNLSNAHPVMRFKQIVPPSKIATVLGNTKTWTVTAGTNVNFFNLSDTSLVANLNNETANLGCVTATVTGAGNGLVASAFSATTNRSRKEVTITPTINGATTTYDATIYMTTTELSGTAPATLYLVKTEQPTDATVTASNSTLVTPTLITATNYTGFKGTFTGVTGSRFFLTDNVLCNPPAAAITASGTTTFCLGSSVTLTGTPGTGYTYQWQNGAVNIAGATSATYTATHGGNYTVLITSGGCTGSSAVTAVSVDSIYAAPIGAVTTGVCVGRQITLTDITTPGTWSSGATGIATVDASGHVGGASPGTVTISYAHTNSCGTSTATITLTVNANPTVAVITGTTSICAGTTTTLADATGAGAWASAGTGVATISSGGVIGGAGAGSTTISYTVTNGLGCSTTQTTPVTIFPIPTAAISASGPTTFCLGGSVTLSTPVVSGVTYQWQNAGAPIAGATNNYYNVTTTGSINVVVTNTSNCSTTSSTISTVLNPGLILTPSVSIGAAPGLVLCTTSSSVTYTATSVNGGTTPLYEWYVNGTGVSTGATFTYTPTDGDQVMCMLTSSNVCAVPDTVSTAVSMLISPLVHPLASINALPNDTVCTGTMSTYVGIPAYGGTAPAYRWNKNGVNVATGPAYNYVPNNGDVLVVTLTSNFPCRTQDTGVSAPLTITVDTSSINTITVTSDYTAAAPGTLITFTAHAPNAGSSPAYQWYLNGMPITGATSTTYATTTLVSGQIVTCGVTSSNFCAAPGTAMSAGMTVNVTNGVGSVTTGNTFMLLPNPNNGTFSIKGTLVTNGNEIDIRVTNMLGQVVYSSTAAVQNNTVNETITLNHSLAAGVYMVNVTSAGGNAVFHVVVNK